MASPDPKRRSTKAPVKSGGSKSGGKSASKPGGGGAKSASKAAPKAGGKKTAKKSGSRAAEAAVTAPAIVEKERVAEGTRPGQQEAARGFAIDAARTLADDKCRDVVLMDVRGRSQVTDFIVVGTGSSDRQMRSSGEHVDDLAEKRSMRLYRHNLKEPNAKWVYLDFVDVVVHLFEADTRLYYDIEMLWGDAPRVAWERPGDLKAREAEEQAPASRNRAGLRRDEVL